MRCLVTGGAGFIGSHVVDLLIDEGHEVVVVDNLSTGKKKNLHKKSQFIHDEIENPKLWQRLPKKHGKFDAVFHLAALARIQPSIAEPLRPHSANVNGTLNVLEHCRQQGSKLVFSSSSSLYTGKKLPTHEKSEMYAKNPYSLQKYICEQYIKLYEEIYGLKSAVLRYFNVYGERQLINGKYATVIGVFMDQKAKGKPLTITHDGEQRRDFTHVFDVARANLMAIDWQGTFNIGTGRNYSINEVAKMIGGRKKYVGSRPGEARHTMADNSRARKMGWAPTIKLEEWLSG